MENYNFLSISIMGQRNDCFDGGIYIVSIMKGGAVAADGKIEQGDILLQVNDVNFENMSNDGAVRLHEEIVSKTGSFISLTVAKNWDLSPRSYFTIPRVFDDLSLLAGKTEMATLVKMMQHPDSGLEIKDRIWLKITIANGVIGADVVDWLYSRVEGFKDRHDARKYASSLLKQGYLRHFISKITFSDQCYYTFGDFCQSDTHITVHFLK
ncbi:segment polarity protein dishevelled homolog DVL-1b isoform X1 [Silurus meridionalis]|uniref:segment polarity protein dishevelled homolog DVL-1b isoform X1 n=2 Tax=Silurus meridionalis TaxID=175797 RepID=UPI001EEBCDF9|nr:segment polarity protein dishevelled homolog DVL-1b isoform X1 [Silurus meridionalis]